MVTDDVSNKTTSGTVCHEQHTFRFQGWALLVKLPKTCVSALILISVLRVKPCKQVSWSPLGIPVVRDAVGHDYQRLFFVLYFLTFLTLRYLITIFNSFCLVLLFSTLPPPFQISLNITLPSYSWSSSLPFPSTFWATDLLANFHLPFFPHQKDLVVGLQYLKRNTIM